MKYLKTKSKSFHEDSKNYAEAVACGDSRVTDKHWSAIVASNKSTTQKEKKLLEALGLIKAGYVYRDECDHFGIRQGIPEKAG